MKKLMKVIIIIIILLVISLFVMKIINNKSNKKSNVVEKTYYINAIIKEVNDNYIVVNKNNEELKMLFNNYVPQIELKINQEIKIEYIILNNNKMIKQITLIKDIPKYNDNNSLKIGLYTIKNNNLNLVNDYYTKIVSKKDIGSFQIYPENKDLIKITGKYTNFLENKVKETGNYNIGFNLKFKLKDGTILEEQILRPNDMYLHAKYILVYTYDRIKHKNDSFYSHITDSEFDNKIVISSIKLTANKEIDKIEYPITLTVFSYDDLDDFDEVTNKYRGNSFYTINIYNQ